MSIILDGTAGIQNNATDLSYTGTLTGGTGVVNLGSGQVYKDASGNVGIGTSSPSYAVDVQRSSADTQLNVQATGANYSSRVRLVGKNGSTDNEWNIIAAGAFLAGSQLRFTQGNWTNTPAMLLDSSGNLLVGTTAASGKITVVAASSTDYAISSVVPNNNGYHVRFIQNTGGEVGSIKSTGSTTSYITSSDYRLKNTIAPMIGALDKVALLKPCTYKWIVDGSDGQGFIAHELAEVEPGCVSGEKDAVDAEGKPQDQGIDTSFLVATLAAAIQELKAIIDTQATRITALEAK